MITPISSTIVDLEDTPIPTNIPLGAQEEDKVATRPPRDHVLQLTLSELEVARVESLKWKSLVEAKINKVEKVKSSVQ
jgi:hypothetical protein